MIFRGGRAVRTKLEELRPNAFGESSARPESPALFRGETNKPPHVVEDPISSGNASSNFFHVIFFVYLYVAGFSGDFLKVGCWLTAQFERQEERTYGPYFRELLGLWVSVQGHYSASHVVARCFCSFGIGVLCQYPQGPAVPYRWRRGSGGGRYTYEKMGTLLPFFSG